MMEIRPVVIFSSVFLVGIAEREGWLDPGSHSDNLQVAQEVMSWLATIIVTIALLIHDAKTKKPVVNTTGEITVTQNKFFLQPFVDYLKAKFTTQEKPKEAFVSTGETTTQ